jgi:hypothetical protein
VDETSTKDEKPKRGWKIPKFRSQNKRIKLVYSANLSHRGHFNPFVLYPHFLQWLLNDNGSCGDDFVVLKINTIAIKIPIAIPAQIKTDI